MNAAYDPFNKEMEYALKQSVMAIGQWSVRGIFQYESMMREAKIRLQTLHKRSKQPPSPEMLSLVATMLYGKFDVATKKDVDRDGARDDFDLMRKTIERLKKMETSSKPMAMDIGSLASLHDHAAFVAWNDAGAP